MTNYRHGVDVAEVNTGSRYIRTTSANIIGLVATADDADAAVFPLDRPVLLTSLRDAIGSAGSTGTLATSLQDILDQADATAVVVRVAEGADATETETNVIGGIVDGQRTGLQALLAANAQLSVTPKIIGCPGLDTQAVTNAMISIAQELGGMVYAAALGETKEDAVIYRDNFGQRELMLFWPATVAPNNRPVVASALGLRAKIDAEQGWHKSLSNVAINGITGLDKDVTFDLMSTTHDAHYLNENDITAVIQHAGYRFWGVRTCSSEPLFAFESATRSAQIIKETIGDAHFWAIDKPLTVGLASDILEGINAKLRELTSAGKLIGAEAWIDPAKNTTEQLAQGILSIDYNYTPVPPLEHLQLQQMITDTYFINFADAVAGE